MNINILDYGADREGLQLSTDAINAAIKACAESGGGYVDVPCGNYVSGTIFLEDYVILNLHPGSVILGSLEFSDYKGTVRGCSWGTSVASIVGNPHMNDCKALVVADRKRHCGIIGQGTIDGRRSAKLGYTPEKGRPFLVIFSECSFVTLRDVTLKNPGMFTFYGLNCTDVKIDGVNIRTADSVNGDGLDFDGGKRIAISNCNIDAGDDGIGLKTLTPEEPCEDFTITNCHIRAKHWGAVRIGPESAGDMKRINISNCCFYDCGDGFKLQLTQNAVFEDFLFDNINMVDVLRPFFCTMNSYNMSSHVKEIRPLGGKFRRMKFSNMSLQMRDNSHFGPTTVYAVNYISALPGEAMEDLTFENIHFIAPGGGSAEAAVRTTGHADMYDFWSLWPEQLLDLGEMPGAVMYIRNAKNVKLRDCTFEVREGDARAAIAAECVERLTVSDCEARDCGGLLRYHRCDEHRVEGCTGDAISLNEMQVADWEAYRAQSLAIDAKIRSLVRDVEKAMQLETAAYYDGCCFDIEAADTSTLWLLIPNFRGNFKLMLNGEEYCRFEMPVGYRFPYPFAAALKDFVSGDRISAEIMGLEDFELLSKPMLKIKK
ncbi:MAG: right-handed parallel beta-helix repeat-containing protein [Clostridia bacterium]|nr:right-handed parallel beta-helix repeat-containing protein [Clostridia bacterium]